MEINGQSIFGNEWIDYERDYYKISISEDGVYRIYSSDLEENGINLSQFRGEELQLMHWGQEVPIYVSTAGNFGSNDFIEFIGRKNTGELDKQLFLEWEEAQLNLEYSQFTESSAYFLSWKNGSTNNNRITEEENTFNNSIPVEDYHIHTETLVFSDVFTKPSYTESVRFSNFDTAEGFGTGYQRTHNISFDLTDPASTNAFIPELNIRMGTNATTHILELSLNDQEIHTTNFSGYKVIDHTAELDPSQLLASNTVQVHGAVDANDRYTVAHSSLKYARRLNFGSSNYVEFQSRNNSSAFSYSINTIDNSSNEFVVLDESEGIRYSVETSNDKINFTLPAGSTSRTIHMFDPSDGYKIVDRIEARRFIDYTTENPEYLILTSEKLNPTSGLNKVQEYADYRSSEIGGAYNSYVINVEQLYDQFAFGVIRNPLSVRNFSHFIRSHWENLEFVFIVGKGVEYASYRTEEQINDPTTPSFYVPTWGFPGSDNLLLADKGFSAPSVSVGRIAARDAVDISNYLNKVIDHDLVFTTGQTQEEKSWTKEIIHLSGGDPTIQESLYQHLLDMEDIIESSAFGAEVTTYRKSSADPLQSATSSEILSNINRGKAIITFFGHSGVGTFDFSLEDVAEWKNEGKLPMIISLGCHSGNIHGTSNALGLSESFILEPEKGAILFLASSSSAFISPQAVAGKSYYDSFGNAHFGNPVGNSIFDYLSNFNNAQSLSVKSLNQQLTFHGDPAVEFYTNQSPDYITDNTSIKIATENLTITDPEIPVKFDILNLGSAISDEMEVRVSHYLPDNTLFREYTERIGNIRYKSSIEFTLENPGLAAAGKNRIDIVLDSQNEITELPNPDAEENNTLSNTVSDDGFCFFINSNIVKPKFPNDFGIINTSDIKFIATGNNAFNIETEYILELDTTDVFNSPLLSETISQENGTIEWNPSFAYQDGTVYYWRISPNNVAGTNLWQHSSFIYLENEPEGWNQSHFYQYLYDDLSEARFEGRTLRFGQELEETTLNLFVPDGSTVRPRYWRANTTLGFAKIWEITETGICVLIRGEEDLAFVENAPPGEHGSWSKSGTKRVFFFATDSAEKRIALVNFLEDVVTDGQHVFLNTIHNDENGNLFGEEWAQDSLSNDGKNIFNVLESYGANDIRKLETNNSHYAIFFTKGGAVSDEAFSVNLSEEINPSATLPKTKEDGVIQSTLIGPSVAWSTLQTRIEGIEDHDSISLNVYGIDYDNNETLLYENISTGLFDLSETSASSYPFLKLRYFAADATNYTFPELEYWRVNHRPVPEVIYNTNELLSFNSDELFIGEQLRFDASVKNITSSDMDSLLVKYSIIDQENNIVDTYNRNSPLTANDAYSIQFENSTDNLAPGDYQFIAELNPDEDQAEQEHFDNFFVKSFLVIGDQINPILDVTFDKKHILNGQTVSSSPLIELILTDPEATLLLDDLSDFQIALFHPDGSQENIDVLNDTRITFTPGTISNNQAIVLFSPTFEPGEYTFLAQAKDRSGNFAGGLEYRVDFVVSGTNAISGITVFPNPSSSVINLMIDIEGESAPESVDIYIHNMLGQKLIQLNTLDAGINLTVGSNIIPISEYISRGLLPAGIYNYSLELSESAQGNFPENYTESSVGKFLIVD